MSIQGNVNLIATRATDGGMEARQEETREREAGGYGGTRMIELRRDWPSEGGHLGRSKVVGSEASAYAGLTMVCKKSNLNGSCKSRHRFARTLPRPISSASKPRLSKIPHGE